MPKADRCIGIGVIGLGTVGGGVVKLINSHRESYVSGYGIHLEVVRGCALVPEAADACGLPRERFTDNWRELISDQAVDIVVELIGGEHPALEIHEAAIAAGKHIVTANKALLGVHVEHLGTLAAKAGVQIKCEAAAAGGIPVVNALEHALVANRILTIAGILNGTTNYILSRMEREGADYADVLADAQRLGFAEADPTADVGGFDAASKTAILASIGFHTRVTAADVFVEGIERISAEDIAVASELGYAIKLLGIARASEHGVEARVHPAMIPADHQLAAVSGPMNAVYIVGDAVGETMFYGAGAGSFPTASAVVGDILALAEPMSRGEEPLAEIEPYDRVLPILSMHELTNRFYLRLLVEDRAGALAATSEVLARRAISISSIRQLDGDGTGGACTVVLLTHEAREADVAAALDELAQLSCVREVANVIRIEDVDAWTQGTDLA
ncbi:homoserine dehydrogenase [Collinsella sp. AGMB00827]|uniref:Homoserine dehydrogenase n=1 Tax=Collinsella ureilytica TaxID=2869515 RepID=A0ABS7MLI7_9ACTN|nr:homoserine dehydrogenase [Collinsella urealyticum]MBY4798142.1 homoserine dehydrogenase [Collinsella urealyticum]